MPFNFINKLFSRNPGPMESRRIAVVKKVLTLYKFLETEYHYDSRIIVEHDKYPAGPKYYIIRYTNKQAQRQVEIVVHRNSDPIYRYVKRLAEGRIPDYKDIENCYKFSYIDFLNGLKGYERAVPYSLPDGAISVAENGFETLNIIPQVLSGHEWFDRKALEEVLNERGLSIHTEVSVYQGFRKEFGFLITEYDFRMLYDPNNLRPFEQGLGDWLVYGTLEKVVVISIDRRDQYFTIFFAETTNYTSSKFSKEEHAIFEGLITDEKIEKAVQVTRREIESSLPPEENG